MVLAKFLSTLCKDIVKQRRSRNLQYNDVLNNLIDVAAEHSEMTDELMYKTCVQFFTDGYETASQVSQISNITQKTSLEEYFYFVGVRCPPLLPHREP